MGWFKRIKEGITTTTQQKKEAPTGVWEKCKKCKATYRRKELIENLYVCPKCEYHTRIGSNEYFDILFDGKPKLLFEDIESRDFLDFKDLKTYPERLETARTKTNLKDAISVGVGNVNRRKLVIACMDFSFIGGSMGSVVGEKISKG
ncbi:MAG: acetyl-CoA carboxylase carboxyl transferase subunit beta, partial [Saprospiraceae bacterium]